MAIAAERSVIAQWSQCSLELRKPTCDAPVTVWLSLSFSSIQFSLFCAEFTKRNHTIFISSNSRLSSQLQMYLINSVFNYRQVSLTSVPCKVMESVVRDTLLRYFEKQDLLTSCQHGFRKGKSCLTNLLETLESWTRLSMRGTE